MTAWPAGLKLIDVSELQGAIDWRAVAASGVVGAFIRCAEGVTIDRRFAENRDGATAAGLLVGAYQYCRARHNAIELLDVWHRVTSSGRDLTLPPVLDVEETDGHPDVLADVVRIWTSALPRPLVYTYAPFADAALRRFDPGEIPLWLAAYVDHEPVLPKAWKAWTIWQWSGSASVRGVRGNCDASVFRGSLDDLRALDKARLPDTEPAPPLDPMELHDR